MVGDDSKVMKFVAQVPEPATLLSDWPCHSQTNTIAA